MNIKPGIGIDHFIFGMKQDEIEALLGTPNRIILDDDYDESNVMVQYNSIQTRFTFYKNHEDKLGYIRSSHPNLSIDNQKNYWENLHRSYKNT